MKNPTWFEQVMNHPQTSTVVSMAIGTKEYFVDYNSELGEFYVTLHECFLARYKEIGEALAYIYEKNGQSLLNLVEQKPTQKPEPTEEVGVTDLELQVIKNILNSEYMDVSGKDMIGYAVWSWTATKEKKELAGALGSLVKKGYCFASTEIYEKKKEHLSGITEKGYNLAVGRGLLMRE
jgi:hypothetical protein